MRIAHRLAIAAAAALFLAGSSANAQPTSGIIAPGDAAVTGFSGVPLQQSSERIDGDGPSLRVIGLPGIGSFGLVAAPKPFTATAHDIGQVFGVALDNRPVPDIFVAATSAYGLGLYRPGQGRTRYGIPGAQYTPGQFGPAAQGGGPSSIWRIDGQSGQISLFANVAFRGIQNTPASLGALAFDSGTQQLFVVDRATGLIHRFSMDGADRGVFDHGVQGRLAAHLPPVPFDPATLADIQNRNFDTENPRSWGFAPMMRRVYALAMHRGRLFYSVAAESQIWSVGILPGGAFAGDARFETAVSALQAGTEISQITFDYRDQMYVAERGAPTGSPDFYAAALGGRNRVLRFEPRQPGDPSPGYWHVPADEYSIGMFPDFQNADGGVGLSCSRALWSTGERLLDPGNARPGSFPTVDGLQGNDVGLVKPANMPPQQATYANYYDHPADPGSRGHMGSIAIWNVCGGAPPPPPPPPMGGGETGFSCPPGTFLVDGTCLVAPLCPGGTSWRNGYCIYPDCPDGYVSIRGECRPPPFRCRPGETFVDGRCVPVGCPPRLERADNGYCRCPRDLVYRDGECVPPPCRDGEQRDRDGRCVTQNCPRGEYRNSDGICVLPPCRDGEQRDRDGRCVTQNCPNGEQRNSDGRCVTQNCPNGEQRDRDGRCVTQNCPNGEQRNSDGRCVTQNCPNGEQRNSDGRCVSQTCPDGESRNSDGVCVKQSCPNGEQRNSDGICVKQSCPSGEQRNSDGICVKQSCPSGEQRNSDGICVRQSCPSGETRNSDGMCVKQSCPSGEKRNSDGICVKSGGSSHGANGPGCTQGTLDRGGQCTTSTPKTPTRKTPTKKTGSRTHHCPEDKISQGGRCVSPGSSSGGHVQTYGGTHSGSNNGGRTEGGQTFGNTGGNTHPVVPVQTYRGRGTGGGQNGTPAVQGGKTYGPTGTRGTPPKTNHGRNPEDRHPGY